MQLASSPKRRDTYMSDIESVKRICVDSGMNHDNPEKEEKTLSFPTIRVAIQMVDKVIDELRQIAHNYFGI